MLPIPFALLTNTTNIILIWTIFRTLYCLFYLTQSKHKLYMKQPIFLSKLQKIQFFRWPYKLTSRKEIALNLFPHLSTFLPFPGNSRRNLQWSFFQDQNQVHLISELEYREFIFLNMQSEIFYPKLIKREEDANLHTLNRGIKKQLQLNEHLCFLDFFFTS